jgi:flavin-binding protein dodecin
MNFNVDGYELDAYWPDLRFAVELDVFATHGTRAAFERDRRRQEDLKLTGVEMIRLTGPRLEREPRRRSAPWPRCSTAAPASSAPQPPDTRFRELGLSDGTEDPERRRGRRGGGGDRALRGGARRRPGRSAGFRAERLAARRARRGRQRQGDRQRRSRRIEMAVVKIIELVGSSKTSTDDAAKQALLQAQGSLRNIRAVDIVSTGIRGENLDEYRAHVRVAFLIEGTEVD